MRFTLRSTFVAAVAGFTAMMLLATGIARADAEPNNFLYQAEGPLTGTTYSGAIASSNDVDWYVFYVASQTQLDIAVTTPVGNSCHGIDVNLLGSDGEFIDEEYTVPNTVRHILYTTPANVNRYFISVDGTSGCVGKGYSFALAPSAGVVPGAAMPVAQGTGEPNEVPEQAIGPLTGDVTYRGTQDTSNDQDWFYFYANGTQGVDVAVTGVGECTTGWDVYQGDVNSYVGEGYSQVNDIDHVTTTPTGFTKYLVKVADGCIGAAYDLRVSPASALAMAPPPPPAPAPIIAPPPAPSASTACVAAKASRHAAKVKVRALTKRLAHARRAKTRRHLRKKLAYQTATLRSARYQVRSSC